MWTAPRAKLKGRSVLDEIFNRLDGSYPGTWQAKFTTPESVRNWKDGCARTFDREGITLAQIAVGLDAYERLYPHWPPTVPEFVEACKPSVDPVATYHEALAGLEARGKGEAGTWSHPAVYWAATKLRGDLMHQAYGQMKDRWAAVLKTMLARGAWEPIPEPRVLLAPAEPTKLTKEQAVAMMAALGAANIIKRPGDGSNPRAWAEKMLDRAARGDPTLTLAMVAAARAALGELRPLADEIKRTEDQNEHN